MAYHHKSGATKRKERIRRDEENKKNQTTLDNLIFFKNRFQNIEEEETTGDNLQGDDKKQDEGFMEGDSSEIKYINISPSKSVTKAKEQLKSETNTELEHTEIETTKINYDIGKIETEFCSRAQVEEAVRLGPGKLPDVFPDDVHGYKFPKNVLKFKLQNGEQITRDWLVWSESKQALFCFSCRLFNTASVSQTSKFALSSGYSLKQKWKKLYDKIPEHQNNINHKKHYMTWRKLEKQFNDGTSIESSLLSSIKDQESEWRQILHRILSVTLFLGERGLAFRGKSHLLDDRSNGNFLGILELIGQYDPILKKHLDKVRQSQVTQRRLQVHYLSAESQNEFIQCCANKVTSSILEERAKAIYYSIIVDATPDSAHKEQTVIILRYLHLDSEEYTIKERFLNFIDCNQKTGVAITNLILIALENFAIPIADCRGQGYDNGPNMSGPYQGVQHHILNKNPLAVHSPCACHSLNLCGVHAAECCVEAVTFFGTLQKVYNIFSSSTQRWEILVQHIGCSLHALSTTRWSARLDAVKPFIKNLSSLIKALKEVLKLNLTAETIADINGILKYLQSFECILLSTVWFRVLQEINNRNKILQEINATIDVEERNIKSLITDLNAIRQNWSEIFNECKLVAMQFEIDIPGENDFTKRNKIRKTFADEDLSQQNVQLTTEERLKSQVFYTILDSVIGNLTWRYEAVRKICTTFGFLWNYLTIDDKNLKKNCTTIRKNYTSDISEEISDEIIHLKSIHEATFGKNQLLPLQLLNTIKKLHVEAVFPNVCIALRIFCTIPVTVAQAERSFSVLSRIKNYLRSTMGQIRLNGLGTLAIESQLARELDFDEVIKVFASKKVRKAIL